MLAACLQLLAQWGGSCRCRLLRGHKTLLVSETFSLSGCGEWRSCQRTMVPLSICLQHQHEKCGNSSEICSFICSDDCSLFPPFVLFAALSLSQIGSHILIFLCTVCWAKTMYLSFNYQDLISRIYWLNSSLIIHLSNF